MEAFWGAAIFDTTWTLFRLYKGSLRSEVIYTCPLNLSSATGRQFGTKLPSTWLGGFACKSIRESSFEHISSSQPRQRLRVNSITPALCRKFIPTSLQLA